MYSRDIFPNINPKKRGYLIVLEGVNGSGRSSYFNILKGRLFDAYPDRCFHFMKFPNSETDTGKRIEAYSKGQIEVPNEHRVFSMLYENILESQEEIFQYLNNDVNVVIDRYFWSTLVHYFTTRRDVNHAFKSDKIPDKILYPDMTILFEKPLFYCAKEIINTKKEDTSSLIFPFSLDQKKEEEIFDLSNSILPYESSVYYRKLAKTFSGWHIIPVQISIDDTCSILFNSIEHQIQVLDGRQNFNIKDKMNNIDVESVLAFPVEVFSYIPNIY